jgi:hypothetical protein
VIDVASEELLSLTEACTHIAKLTRRRPDKATLFRWYSRGIGGERLETVVLGGRRFTTEAAIQRFIQRRTVVANDAITANTREEVTKRARAAAAQRAAHDEAVERELGARGYGRRAGAEPSPN